MSTKEAGNNLTRSFKISNPHKIKIACVISEWHSEITENLFIGVKKKWNKSPNGWEDELMFQLLCE